MNPKPNKKLRADQLLVKKKLVSSRERAQSLILAGCVRCGDEVIDKPGRLLDESVPLEVRADPNPFVSRGGLKLDHALEAFGIDPTGRICADIGASTGGFTDCLLRHGAARVFAVDVGYGQLDWKLRSDPRVTVRERKNARYLTHADFDNAPVTLAVVDVSFISLKLILPPLFEILEPDGDIIALVKPQFEVGREEVESGGIIKSPEKHLKVLCTLRDFIAEQGRSLCGVTASPITGQKGNREFLIHCANRPGGVVPDDARFAEVVGT